MSEVKLARPGQALTNAETQGIIFPPVIVAIRLLILTEARLNEILTLRWEEVDPGHGVPRCADSKMGAKVIPLSSGNRAPATHPAPGGQSLRHRWAES
ncbi:MAG: hypothetical protein HQL66_07940 [Magnetococcales bacterium]|nr:hypothetical protein [Magnetococcales bacterium]